MFKKENFSPLVSRSKNEIWSWYHFFIGKFNPEISGIQVLRCSHLFLYGNLGLPRHLRKLLTILKTAVESLSDIVGGMWNKEV